jgi:N-acetylglucosamine malate deacetylase 1
MKMDYKGAKIRTSEYLKVSYNIGPKRPLIEDPKVNSNSRVLVLAPHFDDAIIGCGGTISKIAKIGAHVKFLFITDTCYESNIGLICRLVPIDWEEAEESLDALGCFEYELLDLTCSAIHCDKESVRKLSKVINYYAPNIIFLPWIHDPHPDNMMTGLLAACALKECESFPTLYFYTAWDGLFPNTLVEVTETMEDKIAAAKARRSQIRIVDTERRLRDFNLFRLSSMQDDRYCEPFLRLESDEYIKMVEYIGAYDWDPQDNGRPSIDSISC